MVSIEEKSSYITRMKDGAMTGFFIELLNGTNPAVPALIQSDTNSLACNIFSYVVANDKKSFLALFDVLAQRKPSKETEWIYNDFFIFSLICAIQKFKQSPGWVKEILALRDTIADMEKRSINLTFRNILAGNVNVRGDLHQIPLVYQFITKQDEYDNNRINEMFSYLWRSEFPFFDSAFLNIVSIKAIEIAFKYKTLANHGQLVESERFTCLFLQRTTMIASILAWIVFFSLILLLAIAALYFADNRYVKILFPVLTFFGIGISNYMGLKNRLTIYLTTKVRYLLGYNAD